MEQIEGCADFGQTVRRTRGLIEIANPSLLSRISAKHRIFDVILTTVNRQKHIESSSIRRRNGAREK